MVTHLTKACKMEISADGIWVYVDGGCFLFGVQVQGHIFILMKSTWRVQQESRRACTKYISSSSRTIGRLEWIKRRKSLGLLLHHLVGHFAKWHCPLVCHPPTGTVHAASGLCPKQTPRKHPYLQQSGKFKFLSQFAVSLLFLLCPRLLSSLSTASNWLAVLRVANCIPLSVHHSRALYQFTFWSRESIQCKIFAA